LLSRSPHRVVHRRHFRDAQTDQEVLNRYLSKIETRLGLPKEKITSEEIRRIVNETQEGNKPSTVSEHKIGMTNDTEGNNNNNNNNNNKKVNNRTHLNLPPSVKTLDSILNMDMIKNESAETIGELWRLYHAQRDCIHAVIPSRLYRSLYQRSKLYPKFVYPLPVAKSQEISFVWSEFQGHQCAFTLLSEFKANGENARTILTINHYTEIEEEKGIVLMVGEYDTQSIELSQAQCLAHQLQMYYLDPPHQLLQMLHQFHHEPDKFNYRDSIAALENLYDKSTSALK